MDNTNPEVLARAGLTHIIEPNDQTGAALVQVTGAIDAYRLIREHTGPAPAREQQQVAELLDAHGASRSALRLDAGLERWRPRAALADPESDLKLMTRLGGGLIAPQDPNWPTGFEALGLAAPLALWYRGDGDLAILRDTSRLVAIVGSRDATEYGRTITAELVHGLRAHGICIVSGGAYGIDAQAHQAALAEDPPTNQSPGQRTTPPTIAVMAGGLNRFYPVGNEDLLKAVHRQGLLIAEVAPGATPSRWRFLQRNRMIAALCATTIVSEARWRSGALSTAHHAAEMGREVGAVPGSVFSANSAGCHRLIREGAATLVTDAAEAIELLNLPVQAPIPAEAVPGTRDSGTTEAEDRRDYDGLPIQDLLLLDALPVRIPRTADQLAIVAGLGMGSILGGLSRLAARSLAERTGNGWIRRFPNGREPQRGAPTPR
ncbi:DNA-processing protein DprA [Paeniglutamicibacter psychrophenolicus]|uniref:DNA processing protein n=1 Tax=Paeniglutamicibacter psychrophenolicus TaxID=257454 RepID=A0ABS4WEH4_9MICC|nr:DNA-processing protein DprA [Paeniglutamicibacter psychrophenolicus]MBP2374608.1 DNA processing protein [Paeniglutamicibacter psychrophenolicus]